jgi:hypothetical protein
MERWTGIIKKMIHEDQDRMSGHREVSMEDSQKTKGEEILQMA